MKVLTEAILRLELKNKLPKTYAVDSKVLITPSAKQFLRDRNIELIIEDIARKEKEEGNGKGENSQMEPKAETEKTVPRYALGCLGKVLKNKPEHIPILAGVDFFSVK